jgi:hypothetical protein
MEVNSSIEKYKISKSKKRWLLWIKKKHKQI